MRELVIAKNDAGQRLDRYLGKALPALPSALMQKYIRTKRIRLNGARADASARLREGDVVQCYLSDEFFARPVRRDPFLADFRWHLDILYEDDRILLVDKAPGVVCHGGDGENGNTLIHHVQAYLFQSGGWTPDGERSFAPALCNRLDRNTGGIVIAAKTAETLRVMDQKIRDREVEKRYLCLVLGRPSPKSGTLTGRVVKDPVKNQVSVRPQDAQEGQSAVTRYRTLTSDGKISLVECDLVTGRTHQIRAMMAQAGHPLVGDPKYGNTAQNRKYGLNHQALWSWRLSFRFTTPAGALEDLNGKSWQVDRVDFAEKFFPGFLRDSSLK